MKNLLKHFKLSFIFFTLCFIGCTGKLQTQNATIVNSKGEKIPINVEIAKTVKERANGFMNREHIQDGTGMLFVFEKEQTLSFWMKDTPTPLSIAFIDKTGYIKEIYDLTPFSLEIIKSAYSCLYALEVPQGWFKKVNVQVGDYFELLGK